MDIQWVKVRVTDLFPIEDGYALILGNGSKKFFVHIDPSVAYVIRTAREELEPKRPYPHDLFVRLARYHGWTLTATRITGIQEDTFLGRLIFQRKRWWFWGKQTISLDCRVSDMIAVALRLGQTEFDVAAHVFNEVRDVTEEQAGRALCEDDEEPQDSEEDEDDEDDEDESLFGDQSELWKKKGEEDES